MSHNFKKILTEVAGATLAHLIYAAAAGLFTIAATLIGAKFLTSLSQSWASYWKFLVAASIGLGVMVSIRSYLRLTRRRPVFPTLECDFIVRDKLIEYEYHSSSNIAYRRKMTLEALRDGLECYHDKYHWTANGKCVLKTADQSHEVKLTRRKNVWQLYEIHFHKTLNRGETIQVEVIWTLDDLKGEAVPFISTAIEEPTDRLSMSVFLDRAVGAKEVVCEHSPDLGARIPFESEVRKLEQGSVRWEIDKPKLRHHYEIRWAFHRQDTYGNSTTNTTHT